MWGSDYPHPEGTWPNTKKRIHETFADVPEEEVRAMLGETAAQVYGFDADYSGLAIMTSFNFRPVNHNRPDYLISDLWRRPKSVGGLSIADFSSNAGVEKPWGAGYPFFGLGVELPAHLQVSGGLIFYDQVDANPLVDVKRRKGGWFVTLTTDYVFKGALGLFGQLLGLK